MTAFASLRTKSTRRSASLVIPCIWTFLNSLRMKTLIDGGLDAAFCLESNEIALEQLHGKPF